MHFAIFPGLIKFTTCDRTPPYLDAKFTNRENLEKNISDKNGPIIRQKYHVLKHKHRHHKQHRHSVLCLCCTNPRLSEERAPQEPQPCLIVFSGIRAKVVVCCLHIKPVFLPNTSPTLPVSALIVGPTYDKHDKHTTCCGLRPRRRKEAKPDQVVNRPSLFRVFLSLLFFFVRCDAVRERLFT